MPHASHIAQALIDDAAWEGAPRTRRHEWRTVLDELLAEGRFELPDGALASSDGALRLLVSVLHDGVLLDVCTLTGQEVALVELRLDALADPIREYVGICRDMVKLAEGQNSPRIEALDIAKRLVHDEAAETVRLLCRALRPDLATARRLFTLIVTLHVDTTRFHLPRAM